MQSPRNIDEVPQWKRLHLSADEVIQTVSAYYDGPPESYAVKRSRANGRDLAAYLVHRYTTATLREVAQKFGLTHPDSASNLIRRAELMLSKSQTHQSDRWKIDKLFSQIPENRV